MGRARAVPYKGRGSALDEGWLDEICTENRDDEEWILHVQTTGTLGNDGKYKCYYIGTKKVVNDME